MRGSILLIFSVLSCLPLMGQWFPNLVNHHFFDNLGEEHPSRLIKSPDGNLFIGGNSVIPGEMEEDCANIWLLKIDTAGQILWEHELRLNGCEELRDLVATKDGGLVFAGVTGSIVNGEEQGSEEYGGNYFAGKMDSIGRLTWIQSYGGSQLDQAFGLAEGMYREYMLVGSSHSDDGQVGHSLGLSDLWTLKIDTKGQPRFSQVLGTQQNDWGTAVATTPTGDYLVAGYTQGPHEPQAGDQGQGWLLRLTQSGEVAWNQALNQPQGGYLADLAIGKSNRATAVGHRINEKGDQDFWWVQLNETGEVTWQKDLVGPDQESLSCVAACEDGGWILGGYSEPFHGGGPYAKGGEDFWLIRTDSLGQVLWRKTFGGGEDERCVDVVAYSPGVFFALGGKVNHFTRGMSKANQDYWLVKIEEKNLSDLEAEIFVRANNYRINRLEPTRFRARCNFGDRFLWDFGDGTTSEEEHPLKTYKISGTYEVTLTVFVNEHCQKTVRLPKLLEVW